MQVPVSDDLVSIANSHKECAGRLLIWKEANLRRG